MKKNYIKIKELLTEATRNQLIDKSKRSDPYKDTSKGKNRWERRKYSSIENTIRDFNAIQMDPLFKGDLLEFRVKVRGETNNYIVTVLFEGLIKNLREEVKHNNNKLEYKCVYRALIQSFNAGDVYINCNCFDFLFTQNYWATKGRYNAGLPQTSNGKQIANPNDTKGGGCKHVNLVLSNMTWAMKIASVINNYIWYCKDNMENNYAQYIFPKVYGQEYDKAIQLTFNDFDADWNIKDEFKDDIETINLANAFGRRRTQYKKAPEPSTNAQIRFIKKEPDDNLETGDNPLGIKFDNKVDNETEKEN